MGKTYKIIVCGKKALGKTSILEHLIYNNSMQHGNNGMTPRLSNTSLTSNIVNNQERYFSTIEDIYVACWEKDKGIKEKLRFYDTKGMNDSKDLETINQSRHLFSSCDGAVLIFSSSDPDSVLCIEKLKQEIEKSKDKKEICHFILIDNTIPNIHGVLPDTIGNKESIRSDLQNRLRSTVYELNGNERRDALCKPFIDLATTITQLPTKGSIVKPFKPKVFSSNK
jgi:NF-kappa-B inhibitor-interacting Ras-like protein